ncbi:DNA-binding transcriptional regulator, MarR family [Sphingopyxis indica]|uniref:DNA-binding transcriptional regulator, MarR family n=2 Tax=Sphingopyxis indica TaxID=436663 RepID=A0A239HAS1_9SPHN|nr:DNA-binding transcriptional regulator, MarR family [Sphingopyxis indica]
MGARNDQIPASSDYDRIIDAFQRMIPSLVLMNDRVAKKFDLLAVDMQVLHIIALSSSPVTPSAIAETSDIPPSSITRILDRLETRGFIRRAADGFDQRRTRIEAVREAIAPVKDEFETFAHDMRSMTRGFDDRSLAAIARFMTALAALL